MILMGPLEIKIDKAKRRLREGLRVKFTDNLNDLIELVRAHERAKIINMINRDNNETT